MAASLFRLLGDAQNAAGASFHAAKLLLDLGSPQLAQVSDALLHACVYRDTITFQQFLEMTCSDESGGVF